MRIRIKIDPNNCIGCGICTLNAPKIFIISPKGYAMINPRYRFDPKNDEIVGEMPEQFFRGSKKSEKCMSRRCNKDRDNRVRLHRNRGIAENYFSLFYIPSDCWTVGCPWCLDYLFVDLRDRVILHRIE
mgnify:CR=1 FL=1